MGDPVTEARALLAAAPLDWRATAALAAAAPELLARLCDEVERLRVLGPDTEARILVEARAIAGSMMEPTIGAWRDHAAKLDAEIERLRALIPTPSHGSRLVVLERRRQIEEEGWSAEHDADHPDGSLTEAAIMYARYGYGPLHPRHSPPLGWLWDRKWWKPAPSRERALVKAAALLIAEIDRLFWTRPEATEGADEVTRG